MEKQALKRIFEFLEEKEKQNPPFLWKYISGEPLTEKDLDIDGDLNLEYTNTTSLPEGLKVNGDLNLLSSNITSLPEGLIVRGNLILVDTLMTSLPKGLEVGGNLDLLHSKIKYLSEGLKVGANLYINNRALLKYTDEELRKMIGSGFIKGEIYRK